MVLPASTPPSGVECPRILLCQLRLGPRLDPRRAGRVPAADWTNRGCLYGINNGLQTSKQARDKGLSEQSAWACVPGWGQENRGGAVGLVTYSSE